MADFWGVERYKNENDFKDGYSIIKVNTVKGGQLIEQSQVQSFLVPFSEVNNNFKNGCSSNPYRTLFFTQINEGGSVPDALERVLAKQQMNHGSLLSRIKSQFLQRLDSFKKKVKTKKCLNTLPAGFSCRICSISFRDKTYGWKQYSIKIKMK